METLIDSLTDIQKEVIGFSLDTLPPGYMVKVDFHSFGINMASIPIPPGIEFDHKKINIYIFEEGAGLGIGCITKVFQD